jgi:hypothetical protein
MIAFYGEYVFTEILSNQDQQICTYLEEKLHIYAELGELSGFEDVHLEPHLLIKPDPGEPPQAASLLAAALREGELPLETIWFDGLRPSLQGPHYRSCMVALVPRCICSQMKQNTYSHRIYVSEVSKIKK